MMCLSVRRLTFGFSEAAAAAGGDGARGGGRGVPGREISRHPPLSSEGGAIGVGGAEMGKKGTGLDILLEVQEDRSKVFNIRNILQKHVSIFS